MVDRPLPDPRAGYTDRFRLHDEARAEASRRSFRLSNVRGATFIAAAAAFVAFDVADGVPARLALAAGVVLTAVFVALVVRHRSVRREEQWRGALAGVAREGTLRLDRDWDALDEALPPAERAFDEPGSGHPYGRDLNVAGRASLTRLMGPVTSERGRETLGSWLLEGDAPDAATARQGAVRELATLPELRAEYTARGRLHAPESLEGLDPFFAWAEGEPWTGSGVGLRAAAWALPPLLVVGLVAYFVLDVFPWWILPAIAQFVFLRRVSPRTSGAFAQAVLGGPPLRALVPQLGLLEDRTWQDPLLVSLADRLGHGEASAHRHLLRLSRLLDTVESRSNLVYVMLAPVLLLDFHLWTRLDRWRGAHGRAVRDWIDALGEWEAVSALGTLAHDHPDWADPTFAGGGSWALVAEALGHPLLPPSDCVRNDVSVGPPGTFLFVTGSNMSGKSTLLRALGANAVLAAAGAPVCARSLTLPPVRVHTSMRIEDSLAEGVSLFMAELLRIKGIVEAAGAGADGGRPVLYLLDEILHGTNTAERRIAARGVVRHLLAADAIGVVSTHDLTLADVPDLLSAAHAVHFRERVEHGDELAERTRLTFDYRLREGIATTRNALKLLDAVGLGGLDLDDGPAPAEG